MYLGVPEDCLLSPTLFTILIIYVNEILRKRQAEGVVVPKEKNLSLEYGDDIVTLTTRIGELREMRRLEQFLENKIVTE